MIRFFYDWIFYDWIAPLASARVLGLLFNIPLRGVSHLMSIFNSEEEEEDETMSIH